MAHKLKKTPMHAERECLRKENERRAKRMKVEKKGRKGGLNWIKRERGENRENEVRSQSIKRNKVPEQCRNANQKVALSKGSQGNCPEKLKRFETAVDSHTGIARGGGDFSSGLVGTVQSLCISW